MSGQSQVQNNNANSRQARVLEGIARFMGADLLRRDMVGNRFPFSDARSRTVLPVAVTPESSTLTRFTFMKRR